MRRHEDWPRRLEAAVRDRAAEPFAWGRHDCCTAATALIEAMTGQNPAEAFGRYTTERGAARRLKRHGGVAGLAEEGFRRFGAPEIAPRKAQRGDAVLVPDEKGEPALAIVGMTGTYALCPGDTGWIRVPLRLWQRAWRIG